MAMRRKNTAKHIGGLEHVQKWFINNVRRQRRRNKLAKMSRRKNRGR